MEVSQFNVYHNGKVFNSEEELIKTLITESIVNSYKSNPDFKQTKVLTTSVYRILFEMFINNKKIIFLDAPTGTGKSIIGYMIHFGFNYVQNYCAKYGLNNFEENTDTDTESTRATTYTLTSSKMLQEQMDNDIIRFNMEDDFVVLKGSSNYECTLATEKYKVKTDFTNRECKGMKGEALQLLPCYDTCGYIQKRLLASKSPSAIINYAYYLTVMNAAFSPYFGERDLVIADEGHLVPQIVTSMYGVDVTMFHLNKLVKIYNNLKLNFKDSLVAELEPIGKALVICHKFFEKDKSDKTIDKIISFLSYFKDICLMFPKLMSAMESNNPQLYPAFKELFRKEFSDIEDKMITMSYDKNQEYLMSLSKRPEDILIESEEIGSFTQIVGDTIIPQKTFFKFKIRDLSEAEVTKKYFLNYTNYVLFMSATIGDINEFGNLLGLKENEFSGFNIPSTFNFDKSPIYLCNSGYLNYNNFQSQIEKVLDETIRVLTYHHPNDKGIVHTSTFQIGKMLQQRLYTKDTKNYSRYLFYETSEEKEKCIELMKKSIKPYVIIGPSLYEGIDLKDDQGRFNIIVKAPYSGIDNYTREKIKRFPFWYERETLEKLQQAIGRTNRHPDDWSKVYLMDSLLDKLIWKLPTYITQRIKKFRV